MSIRFNVGVDSWVLDSPEYGYGATIVLSLHHAPLLPRGYGIWDDGSTEDYRLCRATFLMNEADTATLLNLWKDSNKARGVTGSIVLDDDSGFFPFGPDLGDAGTFGARMTRLDPSPPLEEPWLYFRNTVEFVMTSNPAYGLPAEQDEGDLQIGGITGLRYPPTFPEPSIEYAQTTPLTRDGTPYTLDKQPADDKYETTLPMVLRHNKAAALVNHMVVTVRDNNVTIVDAGNGYLFGRSPGEGASFACQWLNEVLTVKHDGFDQFSFPLSFYYTGSVS